MNVQLGPYTPANITTATTTLVKTGPGVLHAVIVNLPVASAMIEIRDGVDASGTLIGTIAYDATLLTDPPISAVYDVAFRAGLVIVTSDATDLTVVFE